MNFRIWTFSGHSQILQLKIFAATAYADISAGAVNQVPTTVEQPLSASPLATVGDGESSTVAADGRS